MATVELKSVSKIYPDGVRAVNDISLVIQDREFIVLVGPSGCGKTTTLRMVAGLEEISHGSLFIDGRMVNSVAPKDRDIAMVFQNYALYPHMSVYKNMAFSLNMRRRELKLTKAQIDQRVREAAGILGLTDFLNRRPKALSGGQRQRVAVGRAIVRNPKAFLFDEPLSNLDAKLRVATRAEIKRLHLRLNTTTIYVTHDQEEAMTLGDRIVVMKDGVIQQCAPPLEVYERPVNMFVAGFVGAPPMNFFHGTVMDGKYFMLNRPENAAIQRVRLTPRLAAAVANQSGKHIVLGVRPEALSPNSSGRFSGEENMLQAQTGVMEPLGDKVDVHFSIDGQDHLVCRTDPVHVGQLHPQEAIALFLSLDRCHLFLPEENGRNITI